jgi:hypothetical protein
VEEARPEGAKGRVGAEPDRGSAGEGECGRPRGVRARKLGIRVGVYGRSGIEPMEGDPRARVGVRSGVGAKGTPSTSSINK